MKIRKYYKYNYKTFTQIPLSTATDDIMLPYITYSATGYTYGNPHGIFYPGTDKAGFWCNETKGYMNLWIMFKNPIKLSNISFKIPWTDDDADGSAYNVALYAGENTADMVLVKNIGTVTENTTYTSDISMSDHYKFYRLYLENGGWAKNDKVSLSEIKLQGTERLIEEASEDDYDFYTEIMVAAKPKGLSTKIKRKYYKYLYTTFTQPILSSNRSNLDFIVEGTGGGNNYKVFDNNTSTGYSSYSGRGRPDFTSTILLGRPMCFNKLTVEQRKDNDDNHSGHYFIVYGSNDGINFTQLINTGLQAANRYTTNIDNSQYYSIYRFYASPKGGYDEDEIDIRDVYFEGTEKRIIPGTESDYDFYRDVPIYELPRETNKRVYYKYVDTPWVQPIATGEVTSIQGGSMIIIDGNHYNRRYGWKAMDGVKSGSDTDSGWGVYNTSATQWWQLKLPYEIKITGLKCYQRTDSTPANANTVGGFYTSSDMTTPIGDTYDDTRSTNWSERIIENIPSEGIVTDTLYFQKTGGGTYGGLGEVEITATRQIAVESDASDYDFYKDVCRNYYKYKVIQPGYRELTHITSTGTTQLNTQFYPSSDTKIQAKFMYTNYSGGTLIGYNIGNEGNSFRFFAGTDGKTYLDYGSGSGGNRISGAYIASNSTIYEMEFGNRYVKDIPTDIVKFSGSAVTFTTKDNPIYLTMSTDYGTFYYVKIYENNVLERDLVPCERISDGCIGMYDKVYDVFYETDWIKGNYISEKGDSSNYDFYLDCDGIYKAFN